MAEKNKTFENLPSCAAEYIGLVLKKMRYRRKVRKEVAEELTDHFEEHLRDCKTSEEKDQKAQQLIAEFGDPKLLAILLRRAKKRCRPLWRTVVARMFQALAALIILLVLYTAWFLSGRPVISTDYLAELNNRVRPVADDSLNAAPLYKKAVEMLVDVNDVKELLRSDFYDANDAQKELIRNWLEKNEASLALVAKASLLPYCWRKYQSDDPDKSLLGVLLPFLTDYRSITYALCWRTWLNAENSNFDSALSDIETSYRFGRHNKGEKALVEQLVGIAIEGRAFKTTRQILDAYKIPPDTLADFQRRLRLLIDNDNFTMNLQFEKFFISDEIQRCFTESCFGPSHIYPERIMEWADMSQQDDFNPFLRKSLIILQGLFTHPDKAASIAAVNTFYKFWEEIAAKTPARLDTEDINLDAETDRMTKNNPFLRVFMPALGKVNIIAWRNKIDAESTLVILALVRYKQDNGNYTETLDNLVETGYINKIPIDPFSDKPIAYRKTDGDFLLYSWGKNLTDDRGQVEHDKNGKVRFGNEGDWVFWPVEKN